MISKLELKVPPVFVALTCAFLMWALQYFYPRQGLSEPLRLGGLLVFVAIGVAIAAAALIQFKRQQTTSNPLVPQQSSQLVTTGIYRFSRNPMYLAMALGLMGYSSYLGSFAFGLVGVMLFMSFITTFQIVPEERALYKQFGQQYLDYSAKVRRWL